MIEIVSDRIAVKVADKLASVEYLKDEFDLPDDWEEYALRFIEEKGLMAEFQDFARECEEEDEDDGYGNLDPDDIPF